ncbi:MAG: hypothetical protein WD055_04555 [Candidatus Dependentiae bacterium]
MLYTKHFSLLCLSLFFLMGVCSTFSAEQFPESAIYVSDLEANFIAAQEDNRWQDPAYPHPYKLEITALSEETENVFFRIGKDDVDTTVNNWLNVLATHGMLGVVCVKYWNKNRYDLYKKYSLTLAVY